MPLSMIRLGEKRTIQDFRVGGELRRHLNSLGFIKGEQVEVIGDGPGGFILLVKGVKLAINKGLANKILVD